VDPLPQPRIFVRAVVRPNSLHKSESLGYWKTLDEDYHWHIEIMPILGAKARSYTFKEVYYSPLTSETAVKRLRDAKIEG
jgi:hypothetical protein